MSTFPPELELFEEAYLTYLLSGSCEDLILVTRTLANALNQQPQNRVQAVMDACHDLVNTLVDSDKNPTTDVSLDVRLQFHNLRSIPSA